MTKKETFQKICDEYTELANIVAAADYAIGTGRHKIIEELNSLKPSKEMLEGQGFNSLKELIQEIEDNLYI